MDCVTILPVRYSTNIEDLSDLLVDCPSCGQHNPDDKTLCWRCQTVLPTPPPPKKPPRTYWGLPAWGWGVFVLLLITSFLFTTCQLPTPPVS